MKISAVLLCTVPIWASVFCCCFGETQHCAETQTAVCSMTSAEPAARHEAPAPTCHRPAPPPEPDHLYFRPSCGCDTHGGKDVRALTRSVAAGKQVVYHTYPIPVWHAVHPAQRFLKSALVQFELGTFPEGHAALLAPSTVKLSQFLI